MSGRWKYRPTDYNILFMNTHIYIHIRAVCKIAKKATIKLYGYTVHQQYPTFYFPSNAHNFKKSRIIKTF